MDLENYMMPGYFDKIAAISKQMDILKTPFPHSSAIEAALNARKLFDEKFTWINDFNKQLSVLDDIKQASNKFQHYQAALNFESFASKTFKPILPEIPVFAGLEVIRETRFEFDNYIQEGLDDNEEETKLTAPILINEANEVKSIIESVLIDNNELYRLHPRDFEKLTAELLKSKGFDVQLTKETRDGGFDIYAVYSLRGFKPFKMLVECKRYRDDRPVGIGIIRELLYVSSEQNANKSMLVTTSYFSPEVREKEASIPYLLECKDKNDIVEWIKDYPGLIIR